MGEQRDGWNEVAGPGIVTFAWDRIFKLHRDHEVQIFKRAECLGEMIVDAHRAVAYQTKYDLDVVSDRGRTLTTLCSRFYVRRESGLPLGLGPCEAPPTLEVRFSYDSGVKIEPPASAK